MVRWRINEVLKQRGWTAYRLARETGLTVPAVYRLAKQNAQMGRVEGATLDLLCAALGVQPGELLEWVPEQIQFECDRCHTTWPNLRVDGEPRRRFWECPNGCNASEKEGRRG